jgi:hypothetical protein
LALRRLKLRIGIGIGKWRGKGSELARSVPRKRLEWKQGSSLSLFLMSKPTPKT